MMEVIMPEPKSGEKIDLWGAPFALDPPRESILIDLLRGQADALTARTGGLVEGVVLKEIDKGTVWASLYARVPSLENYMYKILTVAHSVAADPDNPSPLSVHDTFEDGDTFDNIDGVEEFRRWLEAVLSSGPAHAVIVNLLRYGSDRAAS